MTSHDTLTIIIVGHYLVSRDGSIKKQSSWMLAMPKLHFSLLIEGFAPLPLQALHLA